MPTGCPGTWSEWDYVNWEDASNNWNCLVFETNPGLALVVSGHTVHSDSLPLNLTGHAVASDNIPLYIAGPNPVTAGLNLAVSGGVNSFSSSLPLSTFGGDDAFFSTLDLYISGTSPTASLNLVVTGYEPDPFTSTINLFVEGYIPGDTGMIPLVTVGEGTVEVEGSLTLVTVGGGPVVETASMNLFLMRQDAAMIPLLVQGPGDASSLSLPFVVTGHTQHASTLPLSMPHTFDTDEAGLALYTHGF